MKKQLLIMIIACGVLSSVPLTNATEPANKKVTQEACDFDELDALLDQAQTMGVEDKPLEMSAVEKIVRAIGAPIFRVYFSCRSFATYVQNSVCCCGDDTDDHA